MVAGKTERSGLVRNAPPGVGDAEVTTLLRTLPRGRGQLRIAGYYQLGWDLIVVYDVLDEQGTRVSDIRAIFPRHHPIVTTGTVYSLDSGEAAELIRDSA